MSDIVERLKNYIPGEHEQFVPEVNALAIAEIKRLRQERDDLKADYLRRHQDACDYWTALKVIAEGYGPNHGSKYCRDTAQAALDEANRRTSRLPSDQLGRAE